MKHKRKQGLVYLLFLLFLCPAISWSQDGDDNKMSVAILPFTYNSNNDSRYVFTIQEAVENAFIKAKRFNMVERSRLRELQAEKNLQKQEDFIDSKAMVSQGKSLGARYMLTGHVVSIGYEESYTTSNGMRKLEGYKGKLNLLLKVIDIESGQILTSETIDENTAPASSGFWETLSNNLTRNSVSSTPGAAVVEVIKGLDKSLTGFIARNFPVTFRIVEIQEKKADGSAKTVLLAGGSGYGLNKGNKLKVVERKEITVDGRIIPRNVEVGEIKVVKVEDANFSVCNVISGGEIISQKLSGNTLIVITK